MWINMILFGDELKTVKIYDFLFWDFEHYLQVRDYPGWDTTWNISTSALASALWEIFLGKVPSGKRWQFANLNIAIEIVDLQI